MEANTNTNVDAEKISVMTRFTASELEVVRALTGCTDNAGAVCAFIRRALIATGYTTAAGAPVYAHGMAAPCASAEGGAE